MIIIKEKGVDKKKRKNFKFIFSIYFFFFGLVLLLLFFVLAGQESEKTLKIETHAARSYLFKIKWYTCLCLNVLLFVGLFVVRDDVGNQYRQV